jgi:glycosyltransferase involved in cell wall biosynthesis
MRLVLLAPTFSRNMGYLENILPRYLARAGIETHVVAMDLPPYHWMPESKETYADFSGENQAGTIEDREGFTVHILGHKRVAGYMRMVGLREKLSTIRPDIVQCSSVIGWIPVDAALFKCYLGYRLFSGNHYHASVFPLASKSLPWWKAERLRCTITRALPGWAVSLLTEKCYAIAPDCADVAVRFFGVPRKKIEICSLGVDTDLFRPASTEKDQEARLELRKRLGFTDSDIVCIYTGRLGDDKNPLLLAQSIAHLTGKGEPFRGLFVGKGTQAQAIQSCAGCTTHAFVPVHELGDFFRAADVGVWPAQESLSMLDAAACGLPIVANHTMTAQERIEGNGLFYRLNDRGDLIRVLLQLRDPQTRLQMGSFGARKMARAFSWDTMAKRRIQDYEIALGGGRLSGRNPVPRKLFETTDQRLEQKGADTVI